MNSFGKIFMVSVFGESHGKGVGVVIDGCPPGLAISEKDFTSDLERRKAGAKGTTKRSEPDKPEILSGVFNEKATGAPITIFFRNTNVRSTDYENLVSTPRPGHADFVAKVKFNGFNDHRGGGHFSARLTVALVAAGVIAKKILGKIKIDAQLIEVGGTKDIDEAINNAIETQNSVGGIVECRVNELPIGLGEPFWESVESKISYAVFAIPAIKGIEFGSGFSAAKMTGAEHNDTFVDKNGKTSSNNAGGINGGITNGNELVFRVAVKPTSSIAQTQKTMNFEKNKMEELQIKGRHDACISLRVPPVLEAVTAIALADLQMQKKSPYINM